MVVPVLGSRGKSLCICVLCVLLSHCLFSLFKNSYAGNFCTGLKPTPVSPSGPTGVEAMETGEATNDVTPQELVSLVGLMGVEEMEIE